MMMMIVATTTAEEEVDAKGRRKKKNNAHPVGISKELQISTPAPALSAAGAEKINDVKNDR